MKKFTRRWFMNAVGASGIGLAAILPLIKGARVDERAEPLPADLPIGPDADSPPTPSTGFPRRVPLGFGSTVIAPGATAIISAIPQLPFKLDRLITPNKGLEIQSLRVGVIDQFTTKDGSAVPTDVFNADAVPIRLSGDVCIPGIAVHVTVYNPTAKAQTFYGAVLGDLAGGAVV